MSGSGPGRSSERDEWVASVFQADPRQFARPAAAGEAPPGSDSPGDSGQEDAPPGYQDAPYRGGGGTFGGGGASGSYGEPEEPQVCLPDGSDASGQDGAPPAAGGEPYQGGGGTSGGGGATDSYGDEGVPPYDPDVDYVEGDAECVQPMAACVPVGEAEKQGYTETSESAIQKRFKNRYGNDLRFVAKAAETGPCSKSSGYETGKHVQVLKGKEAVGAYFKCCVTFPAGNTGIRLRVANGL